MNDYHHPAMAVMFAELHRNDLVREAEASRLAAHVRVGRPSPLTRLWNRSRALGRSRAAATARLARRASGSTRPACATC
jgi:hypothetical protein